MSIRPTSHSPLGKILVLVPGKPCSPFYSNMDQIHKKPQVPPSGIIYQTIWILLYDLLPTRFEVCYLTWRESFMVARTVQRELGVLYDNEIFMRECFLAVVVNCVLCVSIHRLLYNVTVVEKNPKNICPTCCALWHNPASFSPLDHIPSSTRRWWKWTKLWM